MYLTSQHPIFSIKTYIDGYQSNILKFSSLNIMNICYIVPFLRVGNLAIAFLEGLTALKDVPSRCFNDMAENLVPH